MNVVYRAGALIPAKTTVREPATELKVSGEAAVWDEPWASE